MIYIFDVEVYPNFFCATFKNVETGEHLDYELSSRKNEMEEVRALFTNKENGFVGFNCENYDNHICLDILTNKNITPAGLYKSSQKIIDGTIKGKCRVPYVYIDLYKINNYDNNARRTSLKWLEFSMRWKKMADLPYPFDKTLTEKQMDDVIKYCHNDVDVTEEFYNKNEKAISVRKELAKENKDSAWLNYSEPIIGRQIMLKEIALKTGGSVELIAKGRTYRQSITVGNIISDKIRYTSPEFKELLSFMKKQVVRPNKDGELVLKGSCSYELTYKDCSLSYGVGGLHGANKPGVYISDAGSTIVDCDFTSFYPFLGISLNIFPKHLGNVFCEVWHDIYKKRKTFAKSDIRNYVYKIVLNSVFGQMMSPYTPFYDPQAFLAITINGQLIISMLTELMGQYGTIIQVNTDGVTAKIPNEKLDELYGRLEKFSAYVGIELENATYDAMIMRDVNNYIAVTPEKKVKRKGMFEQYEDFCAGGAFHKNPSALIIPKAIENYFLHQTPVEKTVNDETNIHEFLFGLKKKSNFIHCLWKWDEKKGASSTKYDERAIRYYQSNGGGTLVKHFKDMRLINVSNAKRVDLALNIRIPLVDRYADLNKQFYIDEANKWINQVKTIY